MAPIRALLRGLIAAGLFGGVLHGAEPVTQNAIVVVGDESAPAVLAELRRSGLAANGEKSAFAGAKLVVVAQTAADGVRPVHRELLKEMSRADCRQVLWIITDSKKVDDWELLELEQAEARELLTSSGLAGDTVTFAVDKSSNTPPPTGKWLVGWKAIEEFAASKVR